MDDQQADEEQPVTDPHMAPAVDFDAPLVPHDGSHLTGEQVDLIEKYVTAVQRELDLSHWRVHVAADLPPEGARASIHPVDGRRIAMLALAKDWWDEPADIKRTDIVHEVLHLAHHDTDEHIRRFFDGSGDVSDYVAGLVVEQFKMNLERMVDSLSYVFARYMPEWPGEGIA